MASGIENFQMVAACDFLGTWHVIQIPDKYKGGFDGTILEDNGLQNKDALPEVPGLYRLDCELRWNDGVQFMFEGTDPEWDMIVKSHTPLWRAQDFTESNLSK